MRQTNRRRLKALGTWLAVLALTGAGSSKPKKPADPPFKPKVDETVVDLADVRSTGEVAVMGVGLVINLDTLPGGTGSDPEVGYYRSKLLDEMRKRGVRNADDVLKDKTTSLVLVKARIPVGLSPKDDFDVQVELTPASTTTSLAGGWLLPTRLEFQGQTPDGTIPGQVMAIASGPVMTGSPAKPDDPRAGRVLGGAHVKKEVPYILVLKEDRKSAKAADWLEKAVINKRFQDHDGVEAKGMASAKTDQYLTIKVPHVYHQNQTRFFQVVNLLPIIDNPELRAQRQQKWAGQLLDPKTAGVAALRLEGIGPNAVEFLKPGLASPNADVRYFAAEALAYLGDASGVAVLGETAASRREFRATALAALAALDHPTSRGKLGDLLSHPDIELRYGAFNALRTLDPDDYLLGRVALIRERPAPDPDTAMALAIPIPKRRKPLPEDPFRLYVVNCDGPPMVHASRSRRSEIVVFGRAQKLLPPIVLGGAGSLLLNAADGDDKVQISRIDSHPGDDPETRVNCPLALGEVIQELANLNATYPEIVALLEAASRQRNLPGPLAEDRVPVVTPDYSAAQLAGAASVKKDEAVGRAGFERRGPRRGLLDLFRRRNGPR